ncbi:MAG: hypothetical protein KC621_13405, partial [Myxococcales bacterium]|nr:hypothetical protein [Myxococcales bacterium]
TDADTDTDVCGELPMPGTVTNVATSADLAAQIAAAAPGATLVLAPGTHLVTPPLVLDKAITLRSEGVVASATIDGARTAGPLVEIRASGVTLAHLGLTRSGGDLVHVQPAGADIEDTRLYALTMVDPGRYAVVVEGDGADHWVEGGELSCSTIELSDDGRGEIDGECETGGIDAYGVRDWVVRDNHFEGLWCDTDPAGPAARFTYGSRDIQVYRNVMADVARGIVLGESRDQIGRVWSDEPCGQTTVLQSISAGAWNNIVFAYDSELAASNDVLLVGIAAESACDVTIVHNSVYSPEPPAQGAIHQRFATTSGVVANNLVSHDVLRQDNATATASANVENAPFDTWWFPAQRDFHTAPAAVSAIDQGDPSYTVADDIDGEPRDDGAPDVGADERP